MSLPAFWHAAALLAGRVDFAPLRPTLLSGSVPPTSSELAAAGLAPRHIEALLRGRPLPDAGPYLTMADAAWPAALAEVPYGPPVLFLQGDPSLLQRPAIAIVGSRRCTDSGLRLARRLARAVVDHGGVVVSGLAYGIDQAAHKASLGHTVAVLGQGLKAPLTHSQKTVAQAILDAGGLLLSELPPTQPASRWTFPKRNRIIAGLSRATIVVEAARRSGALITARQALALGREVLAVPGSPLSPASQGCLDLIADGAAMARDGTDIAHLLPRQQPLLPTAAGPSQAGGTPLPAGFAELLEAGATIDQVASKTGWPLPRVAATLTALELTGRVQRLPGDRFVASSQE